MTDDIDRAQARDAEHLADSLAEHERTRSKDMQPLGVCYACGNPTRPGLLFCPDNPDDPSCTTSIECRDEYERIIAAQKRQGG